MLKLHQLFASDGDGRIQLLGTYYQDLMIQKDREQKDFKNTEQAYKNGHWRWVMLQEICLDLETKTSTCTILQEMCKDPPNIIELNIAAKHPLSKKKPPPANLKVDWAQLENIDYFFEVPKPQL